MDVKNVNVKMIELSEYIDKLITHFCDYQTLEYELSSGKKVKQCSGEISEAVKKLVMAKKWAELTRITIEDFEFSEENTFEQLYKLVNDLHRMLIFKSQEIHVRGFDYEIHIIAYCQEVLFLLDLELERQTNQIL